jgi:hypothetical protein
MSALDEAFKFIDNFTADKSTQIKLYTVLYNIFSPGQHRYEVFMKLMHFCDQNDSIVVLKKNLPIIDQISKNWGISNEQRIELYKKAIEFFHKLDDQPASYELMLKTIELFGEETALIDSNQDFVVETIVLALQHPNIAHYSDLNELPAVSILKKKNSHPKLLELLHIFSNETLKEYEQWEKSNQSTLAEYKISPETSKNKMLNLSLSNLVTKENVISYADLSSLIGVEQNKIEDWIIDAIVNGIFDARLDQEKEQVIMNTIKGNKFTFSRNSALSGSNFSIVGNSSQKTGALKEKLEKTSNDFGEVLKVIRPK